MHASGLPSLPHETAWHHHRDSSQRHVLALEVYLRSQAQGAEGISTEAEEEPRLRGARVGVEPAAAAAAYEATSCAADATAT